MKPHLRTLEEARAELRRKGIAVARWARDNNIRKSVAYGVLAGVLKGEWGDAHRAAVLLGLKDGEI